MALKYWHSSGNIEITYYRGYIDYQIITKISSVLIVPLQIDWKRPIDSISIILLATDRQKTILPLRGKYSVHRIDIITIQSSGDSCEGAHGLQLKYWIKENNWWKTQIKLKCKITSVVYITRIVGITDNIVVKKCYRMWSAMWSII